MDSHGAAVVLQARYRGLLVRRGMKRDALEKFKKKRAKLVEGSAFGAKASSVANAREIVEEIELRTTYPRRTCTCFTADHPLRRRCIQLAQSKTFDNVIIVCILFNPRRVTGNAS
jgi:hypothetical protein